MPASSGPLPVLAVTGLRSEARIAAQGGKVATLAGGGDPERLEQLLNEKLSTDVHAVISFGIAGGLAPGLRPGAVIVADAVEDGATSWPTHLQWRTRLRGALPHAVGGTLLGADHAVADVTHKAALGARFDAVAVDMESHVVARLAARHGVPFAALRVVADPATHPLPRAALVGMRTDGTTDLQAVVRALLFRPSDLPALLRTGTQALVAFSALRRSRKLLDLQFGLGETRRPTTDGLQVEAFARP